MQQGARAYERVEEVLEDLDDDGLVCDVCLINDQNDDEGNPNLIVVCDGCDATVHQNCYFMPRVLADKWYCDFCTHVHEDGLSPEKAKRERQCLMCPRRTGALIRIKDGRFDDYWIHSSCAWWIPECSIQEGRYGYVSLDAVSMRNLRQRFKVPCDICNLSNVGAVLQCSSTSCYRGFHIPCARAMNYALDLVGEVDRMDEDAEKGLDVVNPLRAYCDEHRNEAYPDEPRFRDWKKDDRQRVCYVQNLINRNRTVLIDMNQNVKDGSRWAITINRMLRQELDSNIAEVRRVLNWRPGHHHKHQHVAQH